jgi:[ribosomal protein S18]-alanine N-acetyltransferase
MIIREFRPNDLRRVYEIEEMSFPDPYDINMLKQLFDFGAGFLVAQVENYVVGYIIFWIVEEDRGHVISLAVDQNYKRQKIGSKLINTAIATFTKFNIFSITLEVKTENKEALDFYKSIGFKLNKKVSNYYEDGSDAFKMLFNFFDNKD